jgi:dimethylsulfone monooxygenase
VASAGEARKAVSQNLQSIEKSESGRMKRPTTGLYGPNKFKLGLFGMNCSNGLTMTTAPEHWEATWENNILAAQLADDSGIDFLLPIGRWTGYRGKTNTEGSSYETLIWASGLLASTQSLTVCGTLHVRFLNPLFGAKQIVTADHIGRGRFALNIVSGWNQAEFDMFGIELIPHDDRYAYTEEWVRVVKRIWTESEPFDHQGRWLTLKDVQGDPKPWGGLCPLLISAGASNEGLGFAAKHVDCLFTAIRELDNLGADVARAREIATEAHRNIDIFASGHTICRPTKKEAYEFYHYIVYEHGDWDAAEHTAKIRMKGREGRYRDVKKLKERLISGLGTYPVIGSYDEVAATFKQMSDAGLNGMALGLINYIAEFPHLRDGVLPRMERLGLRTPAPKH